MAIGLKQITHGFVAEDRASELALRSILHSLEQAVTSLASDTFLLCTTLFGSLHGQAIKLHRTRDIERLPKDQLRVFVRTGLTNQLVNLDQHRRQAPAGTFLVATTQSHELEPNTTALADILRRLLELSLIRLTCEEERARPDYPVASRRPMLPAQRPDYATLILFREAMDLL